MHRWQVAIGSGVVAAIAAGMIFLIIDLSNRVNGIGFCSGKHGR